MAKFSIYPSVFVGLGGTGRVALVAIIKWFSRVFKEVTNNTIPPVLNFVAFDFKLDPEKDEAEVGIPLSQETGTLTVFPVGNLERIEREIALGKHPEIKEWYEPKLSAVLKRGMLEYSGAGQIRQIGRLIFFLNDAKFRTVLNDSLAIVCGAEQRRYTEAEWDIKVEPQAYTFIVSSVVGGSGSGMLIDVAAILRDLDEYGTDFHALLVLQDVFETPQMMDWGQDPEVGKANTYSVLKELDYYMVSEKFSCNYPSFSISLSRPLFDDIFLFSAKNKKGIDIGSRANLSELIAQFVGLSCTTGLMGQLKSCRVQPGYPSNLKWSFPENPDVTYSRTYSSVGVSFLAYPISHIRDILKNYSCVEIIDGLINTPVDHKEVHNEVEGSTEKAGFARLLPKGIDMKDLYLPINGEDHFAVHAGDKKKMRRELEKEHRELKAQLSQLVVKKLAPPMDLARSKLWKDYVEDKISWGEGWQYVKHFLLVLNKFVKEQLKQLRLSEVREEKKNGLEVAEKEIRNALDTLTKKYPRIFKWWRWDYIKVFVGKVLSTIDNWGRLKFDLLQKEAIASWYEELLRDSERFLGKMTNVEKYLEELRKEFKDAEEKIYAELKRGYFLQEPVKARREDINELYNEKLRTRVNGIIKGVKGRKLFKWIDLGSTPRALREIRDYLREEVDNIIKESRIEEISLLDVLPHGEALIQQFHNQSSIYAAPYWQVWMAPTGRDKPQEMSYHVSPYTDDDLMQKAGEMKLPTTSLKEPTEVLSNCVAFITIEEGLPLYYLKHIKDWQEAFSSLFWKGREGRRWPFLHISREAADFPELLPPELDAQLLYYLADYRKIVERDRSKRYTWRNKQGRIRKYPSKVKLIKGLRDDPNLANEMLEQIVGSLKEERPEDASKFIKEFQSFWNTRWELKDPQKVFLKDLARRIGIEH